MQSIELHQDKYEEKKYNLIDFTVVGYRPGNKDICEDPFLLWRGILCIWPGLVSLTFLGKPRDGLGIEVWRRLSSQGCFNLIPINRYCLGNFLYQKDD